MGKYIKVSPYDMIKEFDYFLPNNARLIKTLRVCNELQVWLNKYSSGSSLYDVGVSMARHLLVIEIGNCQIWNSEDNSDEELTFEFCKEEYREIINSMKSPFDEEDQEKEELNEGL